MEELEVPHRQRIGPILWREKYVILAAVVVMVGAALAYTLTASKVYQATAIIQVNVATSTPGSTDTTNANETLAQNYATLLTSAGFISEIRPMVEKGRFSVDGLQSRLSASALPQSALVSLHATGSSPREAETIAQQVVTGFLYELQLTANTRTSQLQTELETAIGQLNTQITALQNAHGNPEQIRSLEASRQALIDQNVSLITTALAQGTSATEGAPPVASSTPISPKKTLNLIAGLLLGVLLGVVLAWLRTRLRPAIHSADDVTSVVDLPLLASIPLKSRRKPDDPALAEAYGILNANLTFALRTGEMHVVTFVGFNAQVGKTSTVEGLGRVMARGGREVLLVDGDMRAAGLSAILGHRHHPGLVDVLQSNVPLDRALVQVEPGLWLLPARPSTVNPATLLSGSRTYALMAELRERFELVLLDSPPLQGLADGLILASQSDGVVLVVRAGVTRPVDLTAATTTLFHHMTPIAGVVVYEDVPVESYYAPREETERAPSTTTAP